MGKTACGMKRQNVEKVLAKHLPDEWMTAAAIVEYIHGLEVPLGFRLNKKNFPPSSNSLSKKIRGSKMLQTRITKVNYQGAMLEYRVKRDAL